jgi:hypothetical protein
MKGNVGSEATHGTTAVDFRIVRSDFKFVTSFNINR